ncbi:Nif3-like dinuclear metal center hexameric protein [Paenibacillus sp. TAF58]
MESLDSICFKLSDLFKINELDRDPSFSKFIPRVYEPISFDWETFFEPEFVKRFNGLMLRGGDKVSNIFLAVFPTDEVLDQFIEQSIEGDLLFMHHPLTMECGDPNGVWGRGFIPIQPQKLKAIKEKKVSVFTCHVPLDYHESLSTNLAIAESLEVNKIIDRIYPDADKYYGLVCEIPPTDTDTLEEKLKHIFNIPYIDFEGKSRELITQIAIVAGCGDRINVMQEAEQKGAQAYITGEIHCHIDNDYGRTKYNQIKNYAEATTMSLMGVSHAASEYHVMETQLQRWLKSNIKSNVLLLKQSKWWM